MPGRDLIAAFVAAIRTRSQAQTTAPTSVESHLMACAAHEARLEGSAIDMDGYCRRYAGRGIAPSWRSNSRPTITTWE